MQFPFDVYIGNVFREKNTWITVGNVTNFRIAPWVVEASYTLKMRSIAKNSIAEPSWESKTEQSANLNNQNYVATDTMAVDVSGNIYDFKITNIMDYPLWENVFLKPGSIKSNGTAFSVGVYNKKGAQTGTAKYTMPIMPGSHPFIDNQGAVKLGYTFRYSFTTMASLNDNRDFIRVEPRFYYVKNDGSGRQEVDLYYHDTVNKKQVYFLKVGTVLDHDNVKKVSLNSLANVVEEKEIETTAEMTGRKEDSIRYKEVDCYSPQMITLPSQLRTFAGSTNNVPSTRINQAKMSVQKWYGEYSLPAETFAVPKGYDVLNAARLKNGLSGREDFWLKDGYIIINFDIETYHYNSTTGVAERHLSYINKQNSQTYGCCNMWKKEGYTYTRTNYGKTFDLTDGDTMFLYTIYQYGRKTNASTDYSSRGTH